MVPSRKGIRLNYAFELFIGELTVQRIVAAAISAAFASLTGIVAAT
jgi:hypothetical protein